MREAWHFVGTTLRDGRPVPPDGEWLHHDGEVVICESGLHASYRILDALQYAPGSTICRVLVNDIVYEQDDKLVCRSRKILWRVAGETVLRTFARKVALDVLHLWKAPEVVRTYLVSGNEELRAAARDAARAATNATWATAEDATRDAVWAATWAAWAAAEDAAEDAVWAAAWAAASAAEDAARAAAWADQNQLLTSLVEEVHANSVV